MTKQQAIGLLKATIKTIKQVDEKDNYEEKCSLLMALGAFSEQVDEATKVLEESEE